MAKPNYSLIVTSWYPTKETPINGIFIKKHAEAISTFMPVRAIYASQAEGNSMEEEQQNETLSLTTAKYVASGNKQINQVRYLLALRKAYNHTVAQHGKPSIIHLHVVFPAGLFVYLLLFLLDVPVIITEHWSGYTNEDGRYEKLPSFMKTVTQKLFNRAKGISAVSAYLQKAIAAKSPHNASKVVITNNILDIPSKVQLSPAPTDNIRALFVGNLNDHEKNVSLLIEAIALIVKQHPQFEITFVGGGNDLPRYKHVAEQLGLLDKHIRFTGYIANKEIPALYKQHHFYMLTSNFETFSIAAAEAIINGLPVISTRCGGPEEFIDTSNGIWIEKKTAEGIAQAIDKMIANYATYNRSEMGKAIGERYSKERIVEQLKNLYHISGA